MTERVYDDSRAIKTQARYKFVKEAEELLFNEKDPLKFVKLKEEIDKIRTGEKELTEIVTDIDAYVENL